MATAKRFAGADSNLCKRDRTLNFFRPGFPIAYFNLEKFTLETDIHTSPSYIHIICIPNDFLDQNHAVFALPVCLTISSLDSLQL